MSDTIQVKIRQLAHGTNKIPFYATDGSAGMDLSAALEKPETIEPGGKFTVPTGIALKIPEKHIVGLVFPRSGLAARQGLTLANSVGVIDSDYIGEILCPMVNLGPASVTIQPGDRIAQIIFMPLYRVKFVPVDELDHTERGDGGFGSTGIR